MNISWIRSTTGVRGPIPGKMMKTGGKRVRHAWRDRTLRTKGLLVVALPLGALLFIAPLLFLSQREDSRTSDLVTRTLKVRSQIEDVVTLHLEASSRLRGFLLTSSSLFLEPYQAAVDELPDAIDRLAGLISDNPEQVARVADLRPLTQEFMSTQDRVLSAYDPGRPLSAPEQEDILHGTAVLDEIKALLGEMRAEENRLLSIRQAAANRANTRTEAFVWIGVPLGLFLGVIMTLLFTRGVARRIAGLEENSRRLAEGERLLSMPDAGDEIGRLGSTLEEASALLQAREAAVRESEERTRSIIEAANDAFIEMDTDGSITGWNRAAETTFGWSRDEVAGRLVSETIIPPRYRDAHQHGLAHFLTTGEGPVLGQRIELEALHRDGHEFPVELTVSVLRLGTALSFTAFVHDITERKRAEDEIGAYTEQVADLYNRAPCGYHSLDPEGLYLEINDTELQWLGYTRDEVVGRKRFIDVLTPSGRQVFASSWSLFQEQGFVRDLEVDMLRKDGTSFPALTNAVAVRNEAGGLVRTRSTVLDMTEYRKARTQLEEQGRLLEQVTDAIVALDEQQRIVTWNHAAEVMFGWSAEEVLGRPRPEVLLTDLLGTSSEEILQELETAGHWRGEMRITPRDGTPVHAEVGVIRTDDVGGTISVIHDVSERKRAEDGLREANAFLDSIVENIPNMIFVKDAKDLRFVRFNKAGEELLGHTREALLGKNDYDFFPEEEADFFTSKDRGTLESKALLDIPEEDIVTSSGESRLLHTKKIPILDDEGNPRFLLGISEDITKRKRAEDQVRQAKDEAERANRAKSEFLSRMSHELRTPLNAILGFGQLLEMDPLPSDQQDSVIQILKAGRHLLDLINEVLDISRIEAGGLTLSPEPVRVADALSDALELIRPLAAARSIAISIDNRVDGHHVRADRQRLKQVLLNLLSNAVKYNAEGGHVTLSCTEDDGLMRIGVTDTGSGIAPEEMGRVFSPFDRLGRQEGDIEGTGLGLALSKGLMEAMGGRLDVESVPGEGSTFTVELPLAESPLALLEAQPAGSVGTHDPFEGQHTILYIEDNLSNLSLIERLFERRPQVRLLSTMQATLGIELARRHLPALILLDLHLPDMGGEEALRRLRADPLTKQIPVIVVSADATSSNTRRLLEAGAADYLTKPLDMARFLEVIDGALRGNRGED
jgi:PAS domain S-box-containing protein